MDFSTYLNFFMWAFDLKNKELAQGMYVDVSLVSKWRTGRRKPKQEVIYQIVETLVSLCSTDDMRMKLCGFLHLTYSSQLFQQHPEKVTQALYAYMNPSSQDAPAETEEDTLPADDLVTAEDTQIFMGDDGYRKCFLWLLDKALSRGAPFQMYLMTTDNVDWVIKDEKFYSEWEKVIRSCEIASASVKIIYHQSHSAARGREYIHALKPFKYLSNVQIYNLAMRQDTHRLFNQTMLVIPHVGACFGTNINHSQNRYMFLCKGPEAVEKISKDFNFILTRCIRTHEQSRMNYPQVTALLNQNISFNACRDLQMYCKGLPLLTLPADTLERMLRNAGTPDDEITAYLMSHRSFQHELHSYLEQVFSFELLSYLPRGVTLRQLTGSVLPYSSMYFGRSLIYTKEDVLDHIQATLDLLRELRPFHMYFIEEMLYPTDLYLGYDTFMLETSCNGSNSFTICYQQHYLNDVLSYISNFIRKDNRGNHYREATIQRLERLRSTKKVPRAAAGKSSERT